MTEFIVFMLRATALGGFIYFIVLNALYFILSFAALSSVRHEQRWQKLNDGSELFSNPMTPGISVLAPAFNEEAVVIEAVTGMLGLRYPNFEVVVVDDGSTDNTFALLETRFDLYEVPLHVNAHLELRGELTHLYKSRTEASLTVATKIGGGCKADALNAAANVAEHELLCAVDSDSLLDNDALLHIVRPMTEDPDRTVAVGGVVRAVNGATVYRGELTSVRQPKNWWAKFQMVEYCRAFLIGRSGWAKLNALLIISGAFGLFTRTAVENVGGWDTDSLGEDAELLASIHEYYMGNDIDYKVAFLPDPVCWTEVPATREVLRRQRIRWSRGLGEVLWNHRTMMGNPRYGKLGTIALPHFLAFEYLGPIVELGGLALTVAGLLVGVISVQSALALSAVAIMLGLLLSFTALSADEVLHHRYDRWSDFFMAFVVAIVENFGFRQMHAWWRLRGIINGVSGTKVVWGEMHRVGFNVETNEEREAAALR